jgi:hypothetical protein
LGFDEGQRVHEFSSSQTVLSLRTNRFVPVINLSVVRFIPRSRE